MRSPVNKLAIIILVTTGFYHAAAQGGLSDHELLGRAEFSNRGYDHHPRPFLTKGASNALIRYNPLAYVAGGLLYIYQNGISPQLSSSCLYNPSCSEFSRQAIREYGLFKGICLTADRISRCNRISALDLKPFHFSPSDYRVHESLRNFGHLR